MKTRKQNPKRRLNRSDRIYAETGVNVKPLSAKLILSALSFILIISPANADPLDSPCRQTGIPKILVQAIIKQESSGHPWAVNIGGRSYHPQNKKEALALIRKHNARSFDLGLMQVNSQWLRKFNLSPDLAIEPAVNVRLGIWILAQAILQHGFNWKAVGAYHSPSPHRQRLYAQKIARHLHKLKKEKS